MPSAPPENPRPDDIKAIARFILQTSYDDGISDLTIERSDSGFAGKFADRTDPKKVFEYEITRGGDGWEIGYEPISGVEDDGDEEFAECSVTALWNPAPFDFGIGAEDSESVAIALHKAEDLDIEFLELDNPDLYFLKALLETHYTDGITNIRDVDLDDRDNIIGIFEDRVSPNLTKYFRFRISDDGIESNMLNPEATLSFAEDSLEFKTATKKRNCVKGRACGGSCIPASKSCKTDVPPKAKQQVVVVKMKLQAKKRSPKPGTVADVAIADLNLDPNRFQYKLVHGSTGSSGSLSGVRKWDANLAGIVQVWQDPADGKTYIVNGHNRANLAQNLGVDKVTVRYLDVKDAQEARAVGALTNIAEGRGNALDAAKFFKDSGLTKADLDAKGIPMREKIATDGLALSSLDDSLFRKVIDGDIPTERAAIIGGSGLDHTQQRSLSDLIDKEERRKRKITSDTIKELADGVKASSQRNEFQIDLFGGSQTVVDNAIERAALQANIKQRLSRDKKLFGTVSKSKAAADLQKAGNVIDITTSQKISQDAATTLAIFDQLKNLSGPVSKALNDAADRIIGGESAKKVQDDLYKQITDELPKLVGGKSGVANARAQVASQATLFGETLEYARLKLAGNTKQQKTCNVGFSCGFSCISKTKSCASVLPGQAANYADWLVLQIARGGSFSTTHTKEAQNRGLLPTPQPQVIKKKRLTLDDALAVPKSQRPKIVSVHDSFKEKDAPYVMESGLFRDYKRYTADAYTDEYMIRSDNSGQKARYYARMSDGTMQGLDSAFMLSKPEHYDKLKKEIKKNDASRAASAYWQLADDDERRAIANDSATLEPLKDLLPKSTIGAPKSVAIAYDNDKDGNRREWLVVEGDRDMATLGNIMLETPSKTRPGSVTVEDLGMALRKQAIAEGSFFDDGMVQYWNAETIATSLGVKRLPDININGHSGNVAAAVKAKVKSQQSVTEFGETLEYARLKLAGNTKQQKTCSRGFSCGFSCISRNKACASPLPGQAKNYADWLSNQIKGGGKLSPAHTKEAEDRGLIKNKKDAIDRYKQQIESSPTPLAALEVVRTYLLARSIESDAVAVNASDDDTIQKFKKRTLGFDGLTPDLKKRLVEDAIASRDSRDYAGLRNLTSDGKLDLAMSIVGDTAYKQGNRLKADDRSREMQLIGLLAPAIKYEFKDDPEGHKELILGILDKAFTEVPLPPVKKAAVSQAFSGITGGDAKLRSRLTDTLVAIDKVHDDGELSKIPLTVNAERKREAAFHYIRGKGAVKMTVSKHSSDPEFSVAHEIGHFLDLEALGSNKGQYASTFDPELADWRKAVMKTDAVQKLLAIKRGGGVIQISDPNFPGGTRTHKFGKKYIDYTLETHEIFARSYAQYVATKSQHSGMMTGLKDSQKANDIYPYQWSDKDFKPIADEFDKLFQKKGWAK